MGKPTVVVKTGTAYIIGEIINDNKVCGYYQKKDQMDGLVEEINKIYEDYNIILVSSGAMGTWAQKKGSPFIPKSVDDKAVYAGKGQPFLMIEYSYRFEKYGRDCIQCLLTHNDFEEEGIENLRKIINIGFEEGDIIICNENDIITRGEIFTDKYGFSDNDILSAELGVAIDANLGIMLSNNIKSLGKGGGKSKKKAKEILDQKGIELKILNTKYERDYSKEYGTKYKPNIRKVLEDYFN